MEYRYVYCVFVYGSVLLSYAYQCDEDDDDDEDSAESPEKYAKGKNPLCSEHLCYILYVYTI